MGKYALKKLEEGEDNIILKIAQWLLQLVLVFAIVIFIRSEVFAIAEVSGKSMENTLVEGEKLYLNKLSYNISEPQAGDSIVFLEGEVSNGFRDRIKKTIEDMKMTLEKKPRRNRYIKRVIAVPGDKVDIKDGRVSLNDRCLEEDYIKGITFESLIDYPIIVPAGKIFVMGDNRENSNDSRVFGLVDYKSIEGKITYRIWPIHKIGNNL